MRFPQFVVGVIVIAALILTPLAPPTWSDGVAHAQTADPPGRVGRLNYMSGQVSFAPGGVDQWAAAVLNYPLTTGTALWTDDNARAEFHVGSTAIRMDAMTEVEILNLDDRTIQLRVPQGTIDIGVRQLEAGERFEVGTPSAAVTLTRPGHYRFDVDETGQSVRIAVRAGQVSVSTTRGALSVRAGQTVVVSDGGASPYEIVPTAALDEFGRWALAREQQETQALQVTAPYVPATMTGFEDLAYHGTWQTVSSYGHVWYPRVRSDWAPYRHGRWMYIAPWGWTWVDTAPWGFAPFHYGRWVIIGGRWGWVPGIRTIRPIYAPALVVFVILGGGGIGWFPLAPREVYVPPYRTSPTYYRNINITIVNITIVNVNRVKHVHRHSPKAITVVRQETFQGSVRVDTSPMAATRSALTNATVAAAAPAQATLPSLLGPSGQGAARKPPAVVRDREVIVRSAPPTPAAPPALGQQAPRRAAPVRSVVDEPRPRPTSQVVQPQPTSPPRPRPRDDQSRPTPLPPQPQPTERQNVAPTPLPPQSVVPTPRRRPTPQVEQPQPTPPPRPKPRDDESQPTPPPPQPKPTERQIVVPTPVPPQVVAPTPRPRPTPQVEQRQPTRPPRSTPDEPRDRGRERNTQPTPNCDPRSREYDPAKCPKPTPARTKGR